MYNVTNLPCRSNYDTDEEYENALDVYYEFESRYIDEYIERERMRNNG